MLEIYAELTKKVLSRVINNELPFKLPSGVEIIDGKITKNCHFEVFEESRDDLVHVLESNGIAWQDN